MNFTKKSLLALLTICLFTFSCDNDSDDGTDITTKGALSLEMTDAPVDDASVEAVFVTVADIQVDGQSIEGFSKTTFDVAALQDGQTKLLSNSDLEAKSYSEIKIVLDYNQDAQGNTPGCYAMKQGGQKDQLESDNDELVLSNNFEVMAESQTSLVIDFDLRKCVQRESTNSAELTFASNTELNSYIRVIEKENSGTIKGSLNNYNSSSDSKVIVYAYKKGSFNKQTETNAQAQVQFSNATTSTEVNASGTYELHFLEAGDYEVIYASYKDQDQDGQFELEGKVQVSVLSSLDLSAVSVNAKSTTNIDVSLTGILPF